MGAKKTEIETEKKAIYEEKIKIVEKKARLQKLDDSLSADTVKQNQIKDTIEKEDSN